MPIFSRRSLIWGVSIITLCALVITLLYYTVPENASEEYRYTVMVLFKYAGAPILILFIGINLLKFILRLVKIFDKKGIFLIFIIGVASALIPILGPNVVYLSWQIQIVYSALWIISTFCLGLLFWALARKINNGFAGFFSTLGLLFFLWWGMEIFYLVTPQVADGKYNFSEQSKYVLANQAQANFSGSELKKFGSTPIPPTHPSHSVAHREGRFDKDFFDVRYTVDAYGHRIVPVIPENPKADLLLFGCSYTYGYGLENEETWAWLLSRDLGRDWLVTNYSMYGFGAQQMLDMIVEHEVEPAPTAPLREAVFLTLKHHLLRFTGLIDHSKSYRYTLENGELKRLGYTTESPLRIIPALTKFFNGSQAMRELTNRLTRGYMARYEEELLQIYAAMIIKSGELLKKDYNTRLTVIIWPDIKDLAPLLQKEKIPLIFADDVFPAWGEEGDDYMIVPRVEYHPNQRAADVLATCLARYYKNILAEFEKNSKRN